MHFFLFPMQGGMNLLDQRLICGDPSSRRRLCQILFTLDNQDNGDVEQEKECSNNAQYLGLILQEVQRVSFRCSSQFSILVRFCSQFGFRPSLKHYFIMVSSKNAIINRLGGSIQYEMTVIDFAERLIEDPSLTCIYGNFDVDGLAGLLHDMLRIALFDAEEENRAKQEARLVLHHFRLFQLGLDGSHFARIQGHFREALLHSWVDEPIVEEATGYLDALRPLFDSQIPRHDDNSTTSSRSGGTKVAYKNEGSTQQIVLSQIDARTRNSLVPPTA